MDQQKILEFANYVASLKMYPFFDAANYIVMCLLVRDDSYPQGHAGSTAFSRKHPLACWISSMLMCFSGSILSNLLVGEGIVVPFKHQNDLLLASGIWYALNYSPFDIIYKLCKFFPFRVVIFCVKQVHTVDQVHRGVSYGLRKFSGSYIIPCLIGITKGAGYGYMRLAERLIRGVWTPSLNEFLQPSFCSKACLAASIVFICEHLRYFSTPHAFTYSSVVIFFIYFSVSETLFAVHDPFLPFEKVVSAVFFGGLVDAIARPFTRGERVARQEQPEGAQREKDE